MKEDIFEKLIDEWNRAIQSGDPERATALYANNAILLPTMSNRIRHNHEEIKDYFVHFLSKRPVGIVNESNTRTFDQFLFNSGIYTFSFEDGISLQGRFSFVYQWIGERWLIIEHHSSLMPE